MTLATHNLPANTSPMCKLIEAAENTDVIVSELLQSGHQVIRVLGHDAPYELMRAVGLSPVRLVANIEDSSPLADALIGTETLGRRGRSLLEQILADTHNTPLLITHADNEQIQIFAALRELMRTGSITKRDIHFLDLLHLPRDSSKKYNLHRIEQFIDWIEGLSGTEINPENWQRTLAEQATFLSVMEQAKSLRNDLAKLTSVEYYSLQTSAFILPFSQWKKLAIAAINDANSSTDKTAISTADNKRVVIAGATQVSPAVYQSLQDAGYHVVGDLQDWGDFRISSLPLSNNWLETFSEPQRHRPSMLIPAKDRAEQIIGLAKSANVHKVVYLVNLEDESSPWDHQVINKQLRATGLQAGSWYTEQALPCEEELFSAPKPATPEKPKVDNAKVNDSENAKAPAKRKPRSKKSLASTADFGRYQREWFQSLRSQVDKGSPFAVVGANVPQEILRAMDIPFVVNQWWASIAAAKQQSKRYFALLKEHGYPTHVESYSAQGLAAWFDEDETQAPWGGLPKPDFIQAVISSDATCRIYDHWQQESGSDLFLYERTVEPRLEINTNWWDRLPKNWDKELEKERIDLLTQEMFKSISCLEAKTGKTFDQQKFLEIMALVNEQENYYRLTRNLIANTYPAPVSIVDTMPATMVPQWHRGTVWARDAAKNFYEEVKAKAESGDSVCSDERLRLMWVGRGMWSDMSFYQRWQESHGAVFTWSMYLGLAADGYIREFDDNREAMRALAARFITMGDELRMPTWAGAWYAHEAKTNGIDGAIALSDADPFVLRTLEASGIPVLALKLDNYNQSEQEKITNNLKIEGFLDSLIAKKSI